MTSQRQKRTSLRLVEALVQLECDRAEKILKRLADRAANINLPSMGSALIRLFERGGLCAVDNWHSARRD